MGAYGAEIMPAGHAEAVTPGDTSANNFSREAQALYVGGAGNVAVVLPSGTAVVFAGLFAGYILPVRCIRVNSTDTTATNLVALMTRAR
jgi:hypothetical protein